MGTLHRIKEFIDFKGITVKLFEKSVGFSNGAFGSQLRNNKTIGVDKIENILLLYPEISAEWLLRGVGPMLKSDEKVRGSIGVAPHASQQDYIGAPNLSIAILRNPKFNLDGLTPIPLVSQKVAAGFGSSDFCIGEQDVKDYYIVPKFKFRKIDFMIEIHGSSMYPKYNSGDVIACAIIKESAFIQWNKCHVIATSEQGLLVKRIKEGSDKNHILAISDNKDYPPFEIPKNEITGIAIVVGVIRLE